MKSQSPVRTWPGSLSVRLSFVCPGVSIASRRTSPTVRVEPSVRRVDAFSQGLSAL
jgi:hypothetical protein